VTRTIESDTLSDDGPHFVRHGHFAYESGDHGDTWLTLELLFVDAQWLQRAAGQLADRIRQMNADVICGPVVGGALVAQPVAAALGASFVYAERQVTSAGAEYHIPPSARATLGGRRVVIVDDVINAGSASAACAREVRAAKGELVGVASLMLRDGADAAVGERLGVPVECLHSVRWNIWPAGECPLCRSGHSLDPHGPR
jgi:orotate phosphoribosyltransferase